MKKLPKDLEVEVRYFLRESLLGNDIRKDPRLKLFIEKYDLLEVVDGGYGNHVRMLQEEIKLELSRNNNDSRNTN